MSLTQWLTVLPAVVCCLRGGDLKAASQPPAPYGQQVVAAVLMGEAWGEGVPAMTAVAEVIRRRADLKGISPLAVVVQPKQFTCLNRCTPEELVRRFQDEPDFQKALRIARRLYNHPASLPGHSRGATHFERVGTRAYWSRGHQPVARLGQLAFYKITE
ncbi:MAG: cell wall hydrolase [Verrucomicrobiales bacterium]|nr:cell wall hydrolase [Verrucomicrobiales bacterium]